MPRVIAITQFVFIALGTMAMNILVRTKPIEDHSFAGNSRTFLAEKGLWMLLIPLVWLVFAEVALNVGKGPAMTRFVQATGVAVAVAIFAVYGWLILSIST